MTPCPATGRTTGSCPGWKVGHVVPLACGGPDNAENMQWFTTLESRRKAAMGCQSSQSVVQPATVTTSSPVIETDDIAPNPENPLAVMMAWRDRMCACQDLACGRDVETRMKAWAEREAARDPPPKMSDDDVKQAERIGFEMGQCLGKLERAARSDALTRAMISDGIARVRDGVVACGADSNARGKVTVKVVVGPEGAVTSVDVATAPTKALGECVARAVRGATFQQTKLGGSFNYPFVF